MSRSRQFITCVALITMSALLWISFSISGVLDGFEQEVLRWRYLVRGEVPSETPVVFVNVDPLALAKMGDRPWDRLDFAQTIGALLGPGHAKAVGVDIIFSPIGTSSLLDVDRARESDGRFGEVVDRHLDQIVLAAAYAGTNMDEYVDTNGDLIVPAEGDEGFRILRRDGYFDPAEVPFPEAPTFPIIKFDRGRLGLVNVDEELNKGSIPYKVVAIVETEGEGFSEHLRIGLLRHYYNILNQPRKIKEDGFLKIVDADGFSLDTPAYSSHRLLTIGLEVFLAAHGLNSSAVEWAEDALIIRKEGEVFREIPLIQGQILEVNWLEGWDVKRPATHYSMAEVLEKAHALADAEIRGDSGTVRDYEKWFERFRGKVIFIGGVDTTLKDLAPTPYNRAPVPKVGLHANVYRMLEEEAYIAEISVASAHAITALLSVLVAALLLWSGRWSSFARVGSLFVLLSYVVLVFYSFSKGGYLLPLVAPIGASVSASLFVVLFKLGSEEFQRRRIKNLFGAYVSPSLVDEMVKSERDPQLGGTEVQVTALFSDVEGFSSLSEELSPNELVALMNEYLGAMTETFQSEQGTLDKYIGDAIVTMFGMPYPVEDHAARACRSALRMQERHAELRELWAKEGKWPEKVQNMRTRIGINTGVAVIGNMGSKMRFNYTMMGDSVNLAARCESGAKSYGVYIMITADTLEAALNGGEELNYRKLDRIIVKGRSQPAEIYELWDSTVDQSLVQSCRKAYEVALDDYFKGEWESALVGFEASIAYEPARAYAPTTPSEVLANRCREFIEHGAPEPWDGVYRMTSK